MVTLRTAPETVDLLAYAGDTLTVDVKVPTAFVAGRSWSAQVRDTATATELAAVFTVIEPTVTDGPATLVLSAADTSRLADGAATYMGLWDVQLAPAGGGDPVTTLVRGRITIAGDVTRSP